MNQKPIKNIIFITNLHLWSLENSKGGKAFYNTVQGFKSDNWNIWFISTGGGVPNNLILANQLFEKKFSLLDKMWTSRHRILSIVSKYLKIYFINTFFYNKGSEILKLNKNCIVYAYEVDGVKAAKKLSIKFEVPLVTRFQGTVHVNTLVTFFNRVRFYPHFYALSTKANLCIMTNDGTGGFKMLQKLKNESDKILFWRNGVEFIGRNLLAKKEYFRTELGFGKDIYFITVSRLVSWKKVDRAIFAFAEVYRIKSNVKLLIVGDGEEYIYLNNLVKELNLQDNVLFKGSIEQKEIKKYLIASDIFLSLYDLSNVGNPLMESLMCGKPIITLNVGDTKDVIKHNYNGVLLNLDQIENLPKYMIELIENKELCNLLSKNAYEYAIDNFWSWDDRIKAEITEINSLYINNFE